MDQNVEFLWLFLLGFVAGGYGTIVGAGGGFIIAPVLLFMYPTTAPETITTISLAAVFANALSGTLAYARSKRIDYRYAIVFSLAAVPGAVYGALTTTTLNRAGFDLLFGILIICVAGFLTWAPLNRMAHRGEDPMVDAKKKPISNVPSLLTGTGLSTFLGFISILFRRRRRIFICAGISLSFKVSCTCCNSNIPIHLNYNSFDGQRDACPCRSVQG